MLKFGIKPSKRSFSNMTASSFKDIEKMLELITFIEIYALVKLTDVLLKLKTIITIPRGPINQLAVNFPLKMAISLLNHAACRQCCC